MANVFSAPELLAAAGATLRAGRPVRVVTGRLAGRSFRLLAVAGRPEPALPFFDFLEPVEDAPHDAVPLAYLPSVSLESVPLARWLEGGLDAARASPWVDWRRFASYSAFQAEVAARRRKPSDSERRLRKLARERGAVRFEPESRDAALFRQCLAWKSSQYRRTGQLDAFASRRIVAFFERLFDEGRLVVSALHAGESAVAIHLGCRFEGRFYYWIPAFDVSAAACSPGGLLLEAMLEDSQGRGDREFDFLIGAEAYKLHYATDVRLVCELGQPPLGERAWRRLRGALIPHVRRLGWPYAALQRLKKNALERRLR